MLFQSLAILLGSLILAAGQNALRPDGLPWVHASPAAVDLTAASGEISLKDAAMLFLSGKAMFLDARSRESFAEGHIKGAVWLSPDEFFDEYDAVASSLAGKDVIVAYCDGERCPLSHQLAEKLKAKGHVNVRVLVNGWTLWRGEGLPVEAPETVTTSSTTPATTPILTLRPSPPPSQLCPNGCGN